jgi:hypothetical protein
VTAPGGNTLTVSQRCPWQRVGKKKKRRWTQPQGKVTYCGLRRPRAPVPLRACHERLGVSLGSQRMTKFSDVCSLRAANNSRKSAEGYLLKKSPWYVSTLGNKTTSNRRSRSEEAGGPCIVFLFGSTAPTVRDSPHGRSGTAKSGRTTEQIRGTAGSACGALLDPGWRVGERQGGKERPPEPPCG